MTTTEIISVGVACVTSAGALATLAYSLRSKASGMKDDIIETYEKRLAQIDTDMKALKAELKLMNEKFDKSEADRKKAEEILQGRNPELDRYMALTLKMLTDIHGTIMPQTVAAV